MKRLSISMIFMLLMGSFNANAKLFSPTPSFSGTGEMCIPASYKVGDSIQSLIGKDNNAIIESISESFFKCKEPNQKLAIVQFNITTSSKAIIDISDEYKEEIADLSDLEKFNGVILKVASTQKPKGVIIFYRQRDLNNYPNKIAQTAVTALSNSMIDVQVKNIEELNINGMRAWRFEFSGKLKTAFRARVVYQITILEGDNEYIVINGFTSEGNYENEKEEISLLAYKVSNIKNETISQTSKLTDKSSNVEIPRTQDLKSTIKDAEKETKVKEKIPAPEVKLTEKEMKAQEKIRAAEEIQAEKEAKKLARQQRMQEIQAEKEAKKLARQQRMQEIQAEKEIKAQEKIRAAEEMRIAKQGDGSEDDKTCKRFGAKVGTSIYMECRLNLRARQAVLNSEKNKQERTDFDRKVEEVRAKATNYDRQMEAAQAEVMAKARDDRLREKELAVQAQALEEQKRANNLRAAEGVMNLYKSLTQPQNNSLQQEEVLLTTDRLWRDNQRKMENDWKR